MTNIMPQVQTARKSMIETLMLFSSMNNRRITISPSRKKEVVAHLLGWTGRMEQEGDAEEFIKCAKVLGEEGIPANVTVKNIKKGVSAFDMSGEGVRIKGLDGSRHLVFWEEDAERGNQTGMYGNFIYDTDPPPILYAGDAVLARINSLRRNLNGNNFDQMLRRLRSSDWGIVSSMKKANGSPLFRLQEMISDLDNNSNREMLKYLFSSDSQFKEIIPIQFLLQLSGYRHLANNSNDSNDVAYPFSFPSEKKLFRPVMSFSGKRNGSYIYSLFLERKEKEIPLLKLFLTWND